MSNKARGRGNAINLQPYFFQPETTTIWSFPNRGDWATHSGRYRGNWSPYVPRNLILRYSKPNDWILDQFLGGGTTLIEAKLLNRNAVGIDINPQALQTSEKNLDFQCDTNSRIVIKEGSASELSCLKNEKIDFICTHPPYANIIRYSDGINGDLSLLPKQQFLIEMHKVANEAFRVLKSKKYCAIMIGDIRCDGNVVPLGFEVMESFLQAGFTTKEIIIKEQHNCTSTERWNKVKRNFLLLAHEYIFIFQKV